MRLTLSPRTPLSSPGSTGRSRTPRLLGLSRTVSEYWIPAPVRNCALGGDDSRICLSHSDINELNRRIP
ncbi:hypothetical protein ABIB75_000760 [Bradyrhizobium sp. GM2.2]|jgi:hypothetical protein